MLGIAALVGMLIVLPLKGQPVGYEFAWRPWVLLLLINGFWGIGVGLIALFLMPRPIRRPALR